MDPDENGLVLLGGELSLETVLTAYVNGSFPGPVPRLFHGVHQEISKFDLSGLAYVSFLEYNHSVIRTDLNHSLRVR